MANVFEEMELGRSRVRAALTSAEGLTSQQVGETSALGKALDLPSGVVEADPARARQEMTSRRISEEELFARWAEQRKENAALARDDTDGLSKVFSAAKSFGESVENAGNRAMHWLTFEAADDVQNMGRQLVHGAADFNRSTIIGPLQALSDNIFGAGSETSKTLKSAQDWVKWARPEEVKGDTFLGQLGYDFVRSIPQQAGNIMAALANPAAALSLMGIQIAGGSYADLRDQGVSQQRALISSLANATMQAPLEKIGLDRFMGIFKSANFRDTVVRTLGSMGSEFLTEYVQKYPELATNLWALAEKQGDAYEQIQWFGRTLLDAETLARANREGLYEGLIGAMWGGLGGGVRSLAIRSMEQQKALDFAQRSVELHDAVEGSQTKQVAPDYMEDALDNASDVLAQSVYIPAQAALDLAAQGQDVLTPLGITADQVQQAVETGVDLEVKMSSLQSRLDAAGMAAVSQIMRQNPDAPNAVEASQVDAAAQAQAVVEETRKRQRRADAVLQEEQRLVREMLPLVGKDAAETYGKLHSAQARAFEAAYGVDAAGLMKRRSVGLEDSGTTAGTSFDQTAYHGTPHRFDEFSLDAIGTGEGAQAHGWGLYFAQDRKVSEDYRNRLRKGRSRGQLFEVDIPENDVLLDEQKSFGEQPDAVKQALLAVYKSFPKERLAIVREEAKAQVGRDMALVEKGDKLGLERQQLFNQRRALKTVNAERPAGTNPFDPKSSAKLFDLGRDYLRQMYSTEQIARLENDAGYLAAEKAALKEKLDDVARKIEENERRIEEKRKKDRDAIDRARLGTLLAKMDGASLYSGISAMADSSRAASELLNAHGIRGITYDGGQDGRSFVVFDDKAIEVMQTFYQDAVQISPSRVELNAVSAADPESREYMRSQMLKRGFTDNEADGLLAIMDKAMQDVLKVAKKFPVMQAWQEKTIYDKLHRILDFKLGWIPNRSAFKKNGDYPLNFDLGSLCTKRESMDALVSVLVQEGRTQDLGPTQIESLKDLLKSEGMLTACDICFVETKRARALNDANKWTFEWESVRLAAGINDDAVVGEERTLTEDQLGRLQRMANPKTAKEAFADLMPEDRRRGKNARGADIDTGITADKMQKIAALMLQDNTLAGRFLPEWLLTTEGTDMLIRRYGPSTNLPNVIASMFGAATAKPLEGFNIYDALSWKRDFDQLEIAKNVERIYDIGGFRAQSFTDFNPMLTMDYVQMFADLEARRLPIHIYTKVPALVELFGETGAMINMSLVPEVVPGVDRAHAGLKKTEDGEWTYAWHEDSFPVEKAMSLRQRPEFGGRIGTIAVGISDAQIRMMLDDDSIDMIIPYHAFGMAAATKVKTGLNLAMDYTDQQTTRKIPATGDFNYNRALQDLKDPRKAAQEYLDWCKKNGAVPKFEKFSAHPNYYKLLEDFRGYDMDGNPVIQGPVRLRLPEDFGQRLDVAMQERSGQQRLIEGIKSNERLMEKARKLLSHQRIDGEVRDLMMRRLGSALGKKNVQSLRKSDFFDALEAAYRETEGETRAADLVETFRNGDGIVYGFSHNGKIVLNEAVFNAATPAHEFTHVWAKVAAQKNPELWNQGKALLKDTKEWQEVLDDDLYGEIRDDEDAIASEVLSRIVSRENEDFVRQLIDPQYKMAKGAGLKAKVLEFIQKLWAEVRSIFDDFSGSPLTLEEFFRMPLRDLWDETRNKSFSRLARKVVKSMQDAPKLMAVRDGEKQIMPAEDAEYFAAIEAGDMDAVRQMVREKAERNGFTDAIPEQTNAYVMRTKAAPKKTIKVYKVFTLAPDGSPTALFVSGTEKLPQGVWLDAVDSWHFTGLNGREYIPSTQNPYTKGGKTGGSQKIPSDEIRQELIARGFLPEGSKANTIVALAYRPGWHAGSLPFFPQGGVRPPKGTTSNYPNIHRYNQVVFECELAADIDYTEIAGNQEKARKKDGTIDAGEADLQYLPENGFYYYATNPLTRANPELGAWVISASLKINRALTQEECDTILAEKGLKPQEWEGGTLDLEKLGYTGQKEETARKTFAPITYDDDGNIIPLSQRFDRENPSVLYQGDSESSRRAKVQIDSKTAAIRIFKGADMSSIPHETAHIFVDDLQRVAQDDGSIARERLLSDLEQAGMGVEPFTGILSGEVGVEGAREMLRDVREELAALDDSDAGLRDAAAAAKGKEGKSMRDDISAARQQNTARRRELLPVERILSSYVRHLDGLEQARSDMRTLRRFAGVPEDGVLTNDQWRDVQEYSARGFEQYLAEGKAPVKELNGLFARMMRWLKNLYASWRQYVGADLDDDVRRVFDRMLATEEQIRDDAFVSAALEYEQEFLEEANLSAGERKEIEELRSRAEAEVTAKMDRAVARERGKRYRSAFEQAKESLQTSPFWTFIREMTRRDKPLTEGEASTGGINRDSLVEYLGEDMTKDIAKKMPKLVNAQGKGDTVDSLAMQYPLTDGDADALANLIYEALVTNDGSVNKLAARHAEQALAEQDREVSPEDGLLAGDAYGQYLEAVEKAMQRLGKDQQEKGEMAAARRMEKERLPERYYRNIARQEVENMTVPQLRPDRYVAALRRALSDRSQAVRRGKWVEAVQAMQRARMAFAMMQEVRKARETAERVQKKARKAARVKNGTYPAAQTEAIRKLVEGLGLSAPAQAWDADAEKMTLRELVKASVDDTEVIDLMPIFPDWLLDLENPDPVAAQRGIGLDWKQLVSLEIQQVENLLDFLVHSGREQSKADKASLASRVQAVADAAAASMSGLPTYYAGQRDSVRDDLDKGFSSIDSLEWQARKADGFQNVPGRKGSTEGVMERDVYGALRAATDRYHVRLNSTQRAVTPHLVRLLESAKVWEKKYGKKTLNIRDEQGDVVPVPEAIRRAGETGWTSEMVIGMALNMANDGNRERLRSSYANDDGSGGLTYDMVSMLLGDDAAATLFEIDDAAMAQITAGRSRRDGILSAADWKAIQGVWDVMGSQWADTQAAHKRLYGFAPQGIDPGAFVVRVGDETVRLPGGYYPIKYDPRLDMKMRAQKGKEDILDRSEGLHGVPAARKGFTMARAKHTGRSLRLGVDALQQHLVDSARLIELAYDVRMADKIINNPAFAAEYQRAFGIHDYDRIRPNLKALVVDEVDPDSRLYRWSELARKHLVYYALSLNLNTALMQLTAVFPAVGDVGTLAVSRGLAQLTTRGIGLVRDVWAASPYMERRFRNIDQDLARKALKFKPGRGMTLIRDGKVYTWEDVANLGMSPIAVADMVITTAIWSGAYHKKMKELRGTAGWKIDRESAYHDQAVAYADKVIAQSNPDNDALSRSAFGRDKGIVRLFNSFSGATTKFAQRTRYSLQGLRRGKVTPWEFGRMEIYDMLLPALGMTVMAALIQGAFGGDDDDNEQLAKLIASNTLGQVAMAVPVFGNPASDMIAAAMGAGSGRRGELSSALDTPLQLASTALTRGGKAYRDGKIDGEKLLMSALDIGSYLARIPVGPVARRTARGLKQWEEGEGTPFSIIKPR